MRISKCDFLNYDELLFPSQIARFVSLVPFVEDSSLAKRRSDVWCTSSELLHLTAGDSEEHAHLLAGYFLEIGQQVIRALDAVASEHLLSAS